MNLLIFSADLIPRAVMIRILTLHSWCAVFARVVTIIGDCAIYRVRISASLTNSALKQQLAQPSIDDFSLWHSILRDASGTPHRLMRWVWKAELDAIVYPFFQNVRHKQFTYSSCVTIMERCVQNDVAFSSLVGSGVKEDESVYWKCHEMSEMSY
jgi:hypothetical protein